MRTSQLPGWDLQQALGGQHVFHLTGADAKGQRAKGPMGGGVAVAAYNRHSWLGQPQLRTNDVHDALRWMFPTVKVNAKFTAVALHLRDLPGASSSAIGKDRSRVGRLWSMVATVLSGRRTFNPRSRRPLKA